VSAVIRLRIAESSSADAILARAAPRDSQAGEALAQVEVVEVTWKQFRPDKVKLLSAHL